MKKLHLTSVFILVGFFFMSHALSAQTYDQGIGLRIGDPLGITYKSYFNRTSALELTLGSTSANRHGSYFKRSFRNRDKYNGFNYIDHNVDYTLAFQARLLWHESFPATVEGRLDWYWGIGGHLRLADVEYSYFDANNVVRYDNGTNFDLGPEGILGMEYELLDFPIVAFGEVSLMTELIDNPFRFRFFGAFGIRYAF